MTNWTWVAASAPGTAHVKASMRRQDAFSCVLDTTRGDTLIAVISDGAGSAQKGGEAASLVCRTLMQQAKKFIALEVGLPSDLTIMEWIHSCRALIGKAAVNRSMAEREFAATLILVISSPGETIVVHIGDGSVVVQDKQSQNWSAISWPEQGEYVASTYFITDAPRPKVNLTRHNGEISALILFSDGLERLALDHGLRKAHEPFCTSITKSIIASTADGFDAPLSKKLQSYLNSDAINDRTDDDKTLIVAVRR